MCSLFGGLMVAYFNWRWIFFACAALSLLGMLMVRGTPESKVESTDAGNRKTDWGGIITFMLTMVALQIVVTQGSSLGWTSGTTLCLAVAAIVFGALFFRFGTRNNEPFIDFKLFKNSIFTGATVSNFMLNGVAGMLIVSLQLLQLGAV
ncbi:hypothetical protein [Neisseria perflava]|uniref:hypothetical protein n=1 Tax=Neisseria perflava TaxID=33053 RepID=UPI00209FE019|nr:hypothetical protein [Neisseria perflava]MCP1660268.1 MFS family permease [Neisseria perflava]MCP1771568.1 MFS family permease [Neisseria perflava]